MGGNDALKGHFVRVHNLGYPFRVIPYRGNEQFPKLGLCYSRNRRELLTEKIARKIDYLFNTYF